MKKRTRVKTSKTALVGQLLYTDFGHIGYYRIIKHYNWKEYHPEHSFPFGRPWLGYSMVKIKTEYGIVMKIPFIELGKKSIYADNGKPVL